METTVQNPKSKMAPKAVAAVTTVLFFTALSALLILQNQNWDLSKVLNDTRIQQEKLMGEKLRLEKSVAKFKAELAKMGSENAELSGKINEQLAMVEKLEKENKKYRSTAKQVEGLKKEKVDLQAMLGDLERDMLRMDKSLQELIAENVRIKAENEQLAANNSKLNEHVSVLQEVAINNALVEALQGKKKDRLTVIAKRTKELKMEVDLPASMTQNLTLKVIDPQGAELTEKDGTASITEVVNDQSLTASLTMVEGEFVSAKRMKMEFAPKTKLRRGTYTLEVSNGKKSLGRVQIKLR
ncbi:MAG: hypothetical protein GC178_07930 [Flavobacteriales bacterium]|nr:hypothetical protein [Flavobacteriales bacterium]